MKKNYSLKIHSFVMTVVVCLWGNISNAQSSNGKIWVTFDNPSVVPVKQNGRWMSTSAAMQTIINQYNVTSVEKAFSASKNPELQKVYEITCNCNAQELLQAVNNKVDGLSNPEEAPQYEVMYQPNDYNLAFATDYALDIIKVKQAWDLTMGDTSIVIGISDSNFDINHPELVGKYNYIQPNSNTDYNHGTAVAIEAAGNTDNGIGKSSVAAKCRLRLYTMSYNSMLQACYDGVDVINASWAAGCSFSNYGQSVCNEIYNNGVVLIAAAGNGSTCGGAANMVYPAGYEHVISVTSVGVNNNHERIIGNPNTTHQHNLKVDVSAPGYAVPIAYNGNYITANGTSFASPIVAGIAGLILSANPCLTVDQVEQILKETAQNVDSLNPTYAGLIGAGRVDAFAAVSRALEIQTLTVSTSADFVCEKQVGSVSASSSNGVQPVTYTWNTGAVGETVQNLQAGTYIVTAQDALGCKGTDTVTVSGPVVAYDYHGIITITAADFPLNDLNNDGIIKVEGMLVVDKDLTYEIKNKKIQFGYHPAYDFSGIVVSQGATLNLKNHVLLKGLSTCNSKWDGIIIKDNKSFANSNTAKHLVVNGSKAGRLVMDKVSIHDAKTAVEALASMNEDSLTIYGTFKITNSLFYDNQLGINVKSNEKAKEKNLVFQSMFVVEDSSVVDVVHINMEHVENLNLIKNAFFGNKDAAYNQKGIAIEALNSTLFVSEDTTFHILQKSTSKGNDFYNLTKGIDFKVTDGNDRAIHVTNSYFDEVYQSLNLDMYANGIVFGNEFDQPSGFHNFNSFGLRIGSENTLLISENFFKTDYKEQQNVYGILADNTDESQIKIYKNSFEGNFTAANYFEGDNLGMTIDCNKYLGESYNWYINSGKLKNQDGIDENGLSYTYNNSFSECSSKNSQIFISPNAQSLIYQSTSEFMPSCFSSGFEAAVVIQNIRKNSCPNLFEEEVVSESGDLVDQNTYVTSSLFPNPSVGSTVVNWTGMSVDKIEVYNTVGELLMNKDVSGEQGTHAINNLATGTYFVKLSFDDTVLVTEKLIVHF